MTSLSELFQHSENLPRIVELDLAAVTPNPEQPRTVFDQEKLRELASSIEARGLIHPITVKSVGEGRYIIVAGERRFRAFGLLGRTAIPAIISDGNTDELALIENVQRENLHAIDEFEAVARLIDRHGYTHEEAGRVLGKGRVSITELLSIASIPLPIRAEARTNDRVTKSFLIELAREKNPEAQFAVWTVGQAARTVRAVRNARHKALNASPSEPVTKVRETGRRFARALSTLIEAKHPKLSNLSKLAGDVSMLLDELKQDEDRMAA